MLLQSKYKKGIEKKTMLNKCCAKSFDITGTLHKTIHDMLFLRYVITLFS